MAARLVDREPVSESEFPDLQGNYRESTRNRLRVRPDSPVQASFRGPTRLVSLTSVTGKFLPASRESREANCEASEVVVFGNSRPWIEFENTQVFAIATPGGRQRSDRAPSLETPNSLRRTDFENAQLRKRTDLPLAWTEQGALLGFD